VTPDGAAVSGATVRFLTERECCRLQGFDDSFEVGDHGQAHRFYHCIGNAVCPPIVREIGKALLAALLAEVGVAAPHGAPATEARADAAEGRRRSAELFPRLFSAGGGSADHLELSLEPVPYPVHWTRGAVTE
jgi:hypothetical protein